MVIYRARWQRKDLRDLFTIYKRLEGLVGLDLGTTQQRKQMNTNLKLVSSLSSSYLPCCLDIFCPERLAPADIIVRPPDDAYSSQVAGRYLVSTGRFLYGVIQFSLYPHNMGWINLHNIVVFKWNLHRTQLSFTIPSLPSWQQHTIPKRTLKLGGPLH